MLKKSATRRFISILSSIMIVFTFIVGVFPVNAVTYTYYTLRYEAGDVDNLVGSTSVSYQRIEGVSFDVAASSRFSRKGYKLTSWSIPSTGETVAPSSQYTMPSNDITFVANWTPENYQITFAGVGGVTDANESNVYVNAKCGDVINLPENPFTKSGYVFSGWKYDGVTYDEC